MKTSWRVAIIGGCGRVGLPFGIVLASQGHRVTLIDTNRSRVIAVNSGEMPFKEDGADEALKTLVNEFKIGATTDQGVVAEADAVVIVVGTPVDDHLAPVLNTIPEMVEQLAKDGVLNDDQLIILRSTVYPGVTSAVERALARHDLATSVALCPERISEGQAMVELFQLPQIVASHTQEGLDKARALLCGVSMKIIQTTPEEAELAKLFTNAWRYIKFAIANQFFEIAHRHQVNYEALRQIMSHDYPRASDIPSAGWAAGPCLLKDTAQLAAFSLNQFSLGREAIFVNEGLPTYIVDWMDRNYNLRESTVGILGMAFKAGSDDNRESLSYKLKKLLKFRAGRVLCTDPWVNDGRLVGLNKVLDQSDILVVGAPHPEYDEIRADKTREVIDIWSGRVE